MRKQNRKVKSILQSNFGIKNDSRLTKCCDRDAKISFGYFESMAMIK